VHAQEEVGSVSRHLTSSEVNYAAGEKDVCLKKSLYVILAEIMELVIIIKIYNLIFLNKFYCFSILYFFMR